MIENTVLVWVSDIWSAPLLSRIARVRLVTDLPDESVLLATRVHALLLIPGTSPEIVA